MRHARPNPARGFALLEAMIALLVAAFAIFGIVKLQGIITKGSGDAAARSEAVTLAQARIEQLRSSIVSPASFTALPTGTTCQTVNGTNAEFNLCFGTSAMAGGLPSRIADVTASWTDTQGASQTVSLQAVLAWDDPLGQAIASIPPNQSIIAPVGAAKKGTGGYPSIPNGAIANGDGTYTYKGGGKTELLDATGKVLLYLDPVNNTLQDFTKISGRVYFDNNAGNNALPDADETQVRLSSEGVCIQNQNALQTTTGGSGQSAYSYDSYAYTCYVGPGWYGNVGVTISGDVTGGAASATVCVGDPQFNAGVSNSTLISAHPVESGTRTYRGFRQSGASFLSTGVAGGRSYPSDGLPQPSSYTASYGATPAQNFFNHHFLLTRITGNASCKSKMSGGVFLYNAGKYFCINPHNVADTAVCPSVWPGFESEVGVGGGSINFSVDVTVTGSGAVTSSAGGLNCPSTCTTSLASGSSVTLTANPGPGQTFTGWSGACSGSATTCTLTMDGAKVAAATFSNNSTGGTLTVTKAGTGIGTVTSNDGGIDCGGDCTQTYTSTTLVTLTATAGSGSTFFQWSGGACAGTSSPTCVVTVDAAKTVTATFNSSTPTTYTLTVNKAGTGSGTVTSSPSGITCGSTCSAPFTAGSTVTLTAAAASGSAFTGWSGGGCTGTSPTCTVTMNAATAVTASFGPAVCTTPISGTLSGGSFEAPTATPGGSGNCSKQTGANYSCSLTAPQGTTVTLTSQRLSGQGTVLETKTLAVTATCAAQTNVNFP